MTIADIGRELGISAMTVSRALNGHRAVSEETRKRVLSYAERLHYRPNRWARSLVTRKSRMIGIIIPDISHSFFSEITRCIQDTLEPAGYDLMLCHTHGNAERETAAIEMLLGSRVEGLIVASGRLESDPGPFVELQRGSTPFVLVDRFFAGLDCARVGTDDVAVGRIATEHLIRLGHRKIAHISGPLLSVARQRREGYLQALAENGIEHREEYIQPSSFDIASGHSAMTKLLRLNVRPTAVFAAMDPLAIGSVHACREAGVDVPREMSIIGAGSIEGSSYPNPFLTTIDWSRKELGEKAAEMLLHAISSREAEPHPVWVSQPHVLVRQSTAAPPANNL